MIVSFGWKQKSRVPPGAKVFDVRELTHNTRAKAFSAKVQEIRTYAEAHPTQVIAVGCKLGRHRSPEIARQVASALRRSVFHK